MNEQDKQLLLNDLCARLPYGLFVEENREKLDQGTVIYTYDYHPYITDCKPYLRPMSSMTDEERRELNKQGYTHIAGESWHYCALNLGNAFYNPEGYKYVRIEYVIPLLDWLNKHCFDYRGLIEKGLALEAPNGMYNI